MKRSHFACLTVFILGLLTSPGSRAEVPLQINYQAFLTDTVGAPLNSIGSLTFVLYDDTLKTTELWSETHPNVLITEGAFSLRLGSVTPLPAHLFDGSVRGLAMQFDGGPLSDPATPIVSIPYAYRAINADTAAYALTTAGGTGHWTLNGDMLETNDLWGVTRGNAGNDNYGTGAYTNVNLGTESQTGLPGEAIAYVTIAGGHSNTASGQSSTVGGGEYNVAEGANTTISGGGPSDPGNPTVSGNRVLDDYGAIGGGGGNTVGVDDAISDNQTYGTIAGGKDNMAVAELATVSGGAGNVAEGYATSVGGGELNVATGDYSAVVGGNSQVANADYSFVGGGRFQTADGPYSVVTGGLENNSTGPFATVSGGNQNYAGGGGSSVGGGASNVVLGDYSSIGGGYGDTIATSADYSYLFGIQSVLLEDSTFMVDMPHIRFGDETDGYEFPTTDGTTGQVMTTDGAGQLSWSPAGGNSMWSLTGDRLETNGYWAIGRGGTLNTYYGDSSRTMVNLGVSSQTGLDGQSYYYATVGGGWSTKARHNFATVAGGDRNNAGGEHSSIGGGRANSIGVTAQRATIAGGNGNIANGMSSFIGGGGANQAIGNDAVVVGGWDNDAFGWRSFIGSGSWNRADGDMSVVAGGEYNNAVGAAASVGGGHGDTATGYTSVVGGGDGNYAAGSRSIIGGGYKNRVDGDFSAILGGYGDTIAATADYSYLFGIQSELTEDSTFMVDMPHVRFGDETDGYEIPNVDGSAGQTLVTDGAGSVSWSTVSGGSGLTLPFSDTVASGGSLFTVVNNGTGDGAYFESAGFQRQGVHGVAYGDLGRGVTGFGNGTHGIGVYGRSNDFGDGDAFGGKFESFGSNGRGAYGVVTGSDASGIYGEASGTQGKGVYGITTGTEGRAVAGWANNTGDVTNYGGHFVSNGLRGYGVYGQASNQSGFLTYGGYFESKSLTGVGVYGIASSTDPSVHYGGLFEANGYNGVALRGYAQHGVGIQAESVDGVALIASSSAGIAADFDGDVRVRTGHTLMLGNVALVDDTVITPTLYITGGSDLSERFNVAPERDGRAINPGMLVCIDEANPGRLMLSQRAYDPKVAGVISGAGGVKPGMMMGQSGTIADGDNAVALVGRVYCWADADYGAIRPGDMLTTSNTPGHAMLATDRERAYGTIVGKAMTPLPQGKGLVLVLVGLQ